MCFSTEASFGAAAVLGAMGYKTLKTCSSKAQFFLAAIPILFAIQQFSEGVLWLQLSKHLFSDHVTLNAQRLFLTFAFLIWPIWVPLAFARFEPIEWRRRLLYINLACGVILSLINLSYAVGQPISVQITNHSIQYVGQAPHQYISYALIVTLPPFLSSCKNAWIFGVLITATFSLALYFYETTFVSVWCFFAAITSLVIYKILKDNRVRSVEKQHSSTLPS